MTDNARADKIINYTWTDNKPSLRIDYFIIAVRELRRRLSCWARDRKIDRLRFGYDNPAPRPDCI